jgi:hypothetical protein
LDSDPILSVQEAGEEGRGLRKWPWDDIAGGAMGEVAGDLRDVTSDLTRVARDLTDTVARDPARSHLLEDPRAPLP